MEIGAMVSVRACDVVPTSKARAGLTELADEVVGGAEKALTKNGASFVALFDAKKLDYYRALEVEHANFVLLDEAEAGLHELLGGQVAGSDDLMRALTTPTKL